MLNKNICIKCCNKYRNWNTMDEANWKKGKVYCYLPFIRSPHTFQRIFESPPQKCPFKLEHLLKGNNSNA